MNFGKATGIQNIKKKNDISNLEGSVNCSKYWVRDIMGE